MPTLEELITEWIETRERVSAHIASLGTPPAVHLVGDPLVSEIKSSLDALRRWQAEIDERVVGLLMDTNGFFEATSSPQNSDPGPDQS
ncbi:MAG: hypothetical protein JWM91_1178 [Rhodospirillales bacterium]|nr:hypothetical protein [Rhodospirillales bacterium]